MEVTFFEVNVVTMVAEGAMVVGGSCLAETLGNAITGLPLMVDQLSFDPTLALLIREPNFPLQVLDELMQPKKGSLLDLLVLLITMAFKLFASCVTSLVTSYPFASKVCL